MKVFVHGVDTLLCDARVHVTLYVMRCDHGHNSIDRLKRLSAHARRLAGTRRRAENGLRDPRTKGDLMHRALLALTSVILAGALVMVAVAVYAATVVPAAPHPLYPRPPCEAC